MTTLEKIYSKWNAKRGRRAVNIVHKSDRSKVAIFFFLDSEDNVRLPFKLGVTDGSLNGQFTSDFVGNCTGHHHCKWRKKMEAYTKENYEKGLIDILEHAIKLHREIWSKPETQEESKKTVTMFSMSEIDKISNAQIEAIKLGLDVESITPHKWIVTVHGQHAEIEVLVRFGQSSTVCPLTAVIAPRIELGNNVSFGGVLEVYGLTPESWDGNLNAVGSRILSSLKNSKPDKVSDEEYRKDEIAASVAKYHSHKLLYAKTLKVSFPPLEMSKDYYEQSKLNSLSVVFLVMKNETRLGPYTPTIGSKSVRKYVTPPLKDVDKLRRKDYDMGLEAHLNVANQTFVVSNQIGKTVSISSNDHRGYNELTAGKHAQTEFAGFFFPLLRNDDIPDGEISLTQEIRRDAKLKTVMLLWYLTLIKHLKM